MTETTGAGRFRSPPYPGLPLQRALERVEQLYRQERENLVPLTSAAKAWGMSPTSSGPIQVVGALNQYGLVESQGAADARKVKPSLDALRLILDKNPSSNERRNTLQRCLLRPSIFRELWDKWGPELPSDHTIESYLVLERRLANLAPYSQSGAAELLANYRASIAFAEPERAHNPPQEEAIPEADVHASQEPETHVTAVTSPEQPTVKPHLPQSSPSGQPERTLFVEEATTPGSYLKVSAVGEYDEIALEALSAFVERALKRLRQRAH